MANVLKNIHALCPGGDWFGVYYLKEEPWVEFAHVAVFAAGRTADFDTRTDEWKDTETDSVIGYAATDCLLEEMDQADNFGGYIHKDDVETYRAKYVEEARARARAEKKGH